MAAQIKNGTLVEPGTRMDWVDVARAYGMFLVFYGHFVETVYKFGNEPALLQEKLIYAFHMPLFIFISGFLAKIELPRLVPFLKKQTLTRLLPFLTLSVLIFPFHLIEDAFFSHRGPSQIMERYIDDWRELSTRLAAPPDDQAQLARRRLWEQLPSPVQGILEAGITSDSLAYADREQVVDALNALLDRPDLYADAHFTGAELPDAARVQLDRNRAALTDSLDLRCANWALTWWTLQPDSRYWSWNPSPWGRLLEGGIVSVEGWPQFNVPTWFLLCLFMVELIHFAVARLLSSSVRIAVAIPVVAVLGWFVTADVEFRETFDVWFARESLFLYSFYLLGLLLRRVGLLESGNSRGLALGTFGVCTAVLLLTFDLNPGSPIIVPIVLINLSQHGDPLYFAVTAIAGCLAVFGLARITPAARLLIYVGRHALIFMGMNGLFYHYGNYLLVSSMSIPPAQLPLLFWCTIASLATMAASLPMVWLLDRYVPQLVGRPRVSGPVIPALLREGR